MNIAKSKIYVLIVTEKCNLDCRYCYAKKGAFDMSSKTALSACDFIKKDIKKNGISRAQIIFGGNEPLLNFSKVKLITKELSGAFGAGSPVKLNFLLFSNLWAMEDKILNWLSENEICIHTTLDGPRGLHDLHRGKGSFEKVALWLGRMRQKRIFFSVSAVITRQSLSKYREIIKNFLEFGIERFTFRSLSPLGRAKQNWRQLSYDAQSFLAFRQKAINYLEQSGGGLADERFLQLFYKMKGDRKRTHLLSPPCNGIKKQLCIDPAGAIYVCDEGRARPEIFMIGHVGNGLDRQRVKRFFSLLKSQRRRQCENAHCGLKEICGPCLAADNLAGGQPRCLALKKEFAFCRQKAKDKNFSKILTKWAE